MPAKKTAKEPQKESEGALETVAELLAVWRQDHESYSDTVRVQIRDRIDGRKKKWVDDWPLAYLVESPSPEAELKAKHGGGKFVLSLTDQIKGDIRRTAEFSIAGPPKAPTPPENPASPWPLSPTQPNAAHTPSPYHHHGQAVHFDPMQLQMYMQAMRPSVEIQQQTFELKSMMDGVRHELREMRSYFEREVNPTKWAENYHKAWMSGMEAGEEKERERRENEGGSNMSDSLLEKALDAITKRPLQAAQPPSPAVTDIEDSGAEHRAVALLDGAARVLTSGWKVRLDPEVVSFAVAKILGVDDVSAMEKWASALSEHPDILSLVAGEDSRNWLQSVWRSASPFAENSHATA